MKNIILFTVALIFAYSAIAKENIDTRGIHDHVLNMLKPAGKNPFDSFTKLLEKAKTDPEASYYCGIALQYKMNELSDATRLYRQSIELYREKGDNNKIIYPLYSLGVFIVDHNNSQKGYDYLKEASELGYAKATYKLAEAIAKKGNYHDNPSSKGQLIKLYKKLLYDKKYRPKALVMLGLLYMNPPKGDDGAFLDYEKSRKYLLEAANDYRSLDAYQFLSTLYMHRESKFKDIEIGKHWQIKYYIESIVR